MIRKSILDAGGLGPDIQENLQSEVGPWESHFQSSEILWA